MNSSNLKKVETVESIVVPITVNRSNTVWVTYKTLNRFNVLHSVFQKHIKTARKIRLNVQFLALSILSFVSSTSLSSLRITYSEHINWSCINLEILNIHASLQNSSIPHVSSATTNTIATTTVIKLFSSDKTEIERKTSISRQ